ncbi:hypothetical protein ACFL4Z_03375 [candidate division KSB1 bacterium]
MSFKTESFDIEQCFNESLEAYRKNFLAFVLASLTLFILGPLTIFILFGPLQAGLMMMILSSMKNEVKPKFDDLFKYFNRFVSFLIGFYIPAILGFIGLFFLIIPGLLIFTIWIYILILIADKNLDVVDAMKKSYNLVINNNIWMHIILILIVTAILSILSIQQGPLGLILSILAYPLTIGLIVSAYNQLSRKEHAEVKDNTHINDENKETAT